MDNLTPRELEVLRLICGGYSTNAVAAKLGVSIKTAACHRHRIMGKACVSNSVQLLRWAIKQGLVTVESHPSQTTASASD
jgi:two-component system response regulator NreC